MNSVINISKDTHGMIGNPAGSTAPVLQFSQEIVVRRTCADSCLFSIFSSMRERDGEGEGEKRWSHGGEIPFGGLNPWRLSLLLWFLELFVRRPTAALLLLYLPTFPPLLLFAFELTSHRSPWWPAPSAASPVQGSSFSTPALQR
jgi:hypothetical protein